MSCSGDGKCFKAFVCECKCFEYCKCDFDSECECDHLNDCFYINNPIHKNCVVYCRYSNNCCSLVKCENEFFCNNSIPRFVYDRNDGLCDGCYLQVGKIKDTKNFDDCNICFEKEKIISLNCNHTLCMTCYEKWCETNEDRPCPFCRAIN